MQFSALVDQLKLQRKPLWLLFETQQYLDISKCILLDIFFLVVAIFLLSYASSILIFGATYFTSSMYEILLLSFVFLS